MSTIELMRPSRRRSDRGVDDFPNSQRRRAQRAGLRVDASAASDGIAGLLAAVRPCDGVSASLSRSSVAAFDANASATTWILAAGMELLDSRERMRIVDAWSAPQRNGWPSLITDGGCGARVGAATVTGALRVALLHWAPLAGDDLAVYETGLFREAPANALALLVRPPTIWSVEEALAADRVSPRGQRFVAARFDALERYARGHVRSEHLSRLRGAAVRIESQLPVARFPRASSTIAAGCAVVRGDDEWCAEIAARQLARYASSAFIGREASATRLVEPGMAQN